VEDFVNGSCHMRLYHPIGSLPVVVIKLLTPTNRLTPLAQGIWDKHLRGHAEGCHFFELTRREDDPRGMAFLYAFGALSEGSVTLTGWRQTARDEVDELIGGRFSTEARPTTTLERLWRRVSLG
jgi:hypothetical protein